MIPEVSNNQYVTKKYKQWYLWITCPNTEEVYLNTALKQSNL